VAVYRLHAGSLPITCRQFTDYMQAVYRLHAGSLPITCRQFTDYMQAVLSLLEVTVSAFELSFSFIFC